MEPGFTDQERDWLTALAAPLSPPARAAFLQSIASKLAAYPPQARGSGLLHRVAAEAQRDFLGAVGVGRQPGRRR